MSYRPRLVLVDEAFDATELVNQINLAMRPYMLKTKIKTNMKLGTVQSTNQDTHKK